MDLRLDFYNELNKYVDEFTEDDALLVLSHNKKDGDCLTLLAGDWEILSALFSTKGYVNLTDDNREQYDNIKKMLLNTAYNICMTDNKYKRKFINGLTGSNDLTEAYEDGFDDACCGLGVERQN